MKFRIAQDIWMSQEKSVLPKFLGDGLLSFDKAQHLIGSFCIGLFSPVIALTLGFLWEVKDGLVPFEDRKYVVFGYNFGGDGFSWKDLVADFTGVIIAYLVKVIIN